MNDIVILGDNNGTVVIYIYADDTCIRLSLGEDPIANQNKIDATMALIQNYMDSHKLKFNFRKTEFVLVSPKNIQKHRDLVLRMNGQVVKQKKSARLLGLYITWDMGHEHYLCQMRDNTLEWLGRRLSVLSMLAKTTSYGNLKLLAYGLIYSKVIFGLQFWADCPKRLLDRLQILLNRAARIVMKKGIRDIHVNDLYRCLKWIKLTASSATMICYFISASELLSNLEASAGLYIKGRGIVRSDLVGVINQGAQTRRQTYGHIRQNNITDSTHSIRYGSYLPSETLQFPTRGHETPG